MSRKEGRRLRKGLMVKDLGLLDRSPVREVSHEDLPFQDLCFHDRPMVKEKSLFQLKHKFPGLFPFPDNHPILQDA